MIRTLCFLMAGGLGAVAALAPARAEERAPGASLAPDSRSFELRTYTAAPGKLEALHARFRNHTNALFVKHGMKIVGFWVPSDKDKGADNTLVYLLQYPDRPARDRAWDAFRKDPAWIAARDASEVNGKLVENVESVMLTATDYSPMK
jgi:NIPSNAP protein